MPTVAAIIPTVAARSGSPAVLSRTFHATWSPALMSDERDDEGVHPLDGSGRTSLSLQTQRVASPRTAGRAVGSPTPEQDAADRQDERGSDADPVPSAEHREPVVGRQRELVQDIRQVERGPDDPDEPGHDREDRDERPAIAGPEHAADCDTDAAERGGVQPQHQRAHDRRRDLAARYRRADGDADHRQDREDDDAGHDRDTAGGHPADTRERRCEQELEPARTSRRRPRPRRASPPPGRPGSCRTPRTAAEGTHRPTGCRSRGTRC